MTSFQTFTEHVKGVIDKLRARHGGRKFNQAQRKSKTTGEAIA